METQSDELREQLAAVMHEIWIHLMRHVFSCSNTKADVYSIGMEIVTMHADKVGRWKRQMQTTYAELTEEEKTGDRECADEILALVEPLLEVDKRTIQNLQSACDEYEIRLGADPEGFSQEVQEQARRAIMKEGATCVPEAKAWASTRIKMSLLDWVQYQALRTSCKHCKELPIKNVAKNYVTHHGRGKCLGVVLCTEWLEHNGELDFASRRQKEKEDLGAAIDDYGDCWVAKEPDEKHCPSPPPLPVCPKCGREYHMTAPVPGVKCDCWDVDIQNKTEQDWIRFCAENTKCVKCEAAPNVSDSSGRLECSNRDCNAYDVFCEPQTWLDNNPTKESGNFVDPEILRLKKMARHDRIGHLEKAQEFMQTADDGQSNLESEESGDGVEKNKALEMVVSSTPKTDTGTDTERMVAPRNRLRR